MEKSVASQYSDRVLWSVDDIREKILSSDVLVFARGTCESPRCGFSERLFVAVENAGHPYEAVDVCDDGSIVAALREYVGEQQRLPMVFVKGKLISSSDDLSDMVSSGELASQIETAFVK